MRVPMPFDGQILAANVGKRRRVSAVATQSLIDWIGYCTCIPSDGAPVRLLLPKIPAEPYPRCFECLRFYEECDWKLHYDRQMAERERFREQYEREGHPLYQAGARFAPSHLRGSDPESQNADASGVSASCVCSGSSSQAKYLRRNAAMDDSIGGSEGVTFSPMQDDAPAPSE